MPVIYEQKRTVAVHEEFLRDLMDQGMCARQAAEYVLSSLYDRDAEALTKLIEQALALPAEHQEPAPAMRGEQEVVRAHDVLDAALRDDGLRLLEGTSKRDVLLLTCARNTLCWVLGHPPGEEFVENLKRVEARAKELGLQLMVNPDSSSSRMSAQFPKASGKVQ